MLKLADVGFDDIVLGGPFLLAYYTLFDKENKVIKFAPKKKLNYIDTSGYSLIYE